MKFWTGFFTVCMVWAASGYGGDKVDFQEKFALAEDRATVLEELIPGTEDYYFYHCLQYQNTHRLEEVDALLKTWIERHKRTERVREIQHRQALLRYETDGFNCVHQDVYGAVAFPLQLACLLSASFLDARPAFEGGEFILSEQRPRQQTRVEALTLRRGEGLVFPNQFRPIQGVRGPYKATVKHGVSRIRAGERFTLGVIFHDAR